jgi:hypothetical protein
MLNRNMTKPIQSFDYKKILYEGIIFLLTKADSLLYK